ncbi:MAG: hypothetical protein J1E40_02900 [Oscillospiraceae bacterium]|nr:hypothetical protein [Oscillospiraceae bacterium]
MNDVTFNKEKTTKYLIWTFLITYVIQIIVAILYRNELTVVGQLLMTVMMFVPMIGVLLSGNKLEGMGWKPRLKGKIRFLLTAWFLPALLTAVGAMLYFAVFPEHFDVSGEFIAANVGDEALKQLEAQGLTYPMYILISVIACMTYAPHSGNAAFLHLCDNSRNHMRLLV